jgi:hypothetical protein
MAERKQKLDGAEVLRGKVAVEGMLRCLSAARETEERPEPPPREPSKKEA